MARCRSISAHSTPSPWIRIRRVASVGGGSRIKELLAATLAVGLHTPMGSCGDVGVAGLALAGGDTSPRGLFGTACDNIIGAQLVTADGDVLELGPGQNEDLFWAIRGGGGNFGIVTRLDFRLHPLRTQHRASFPIGWTDIAGALRIFGELIREAPDEVRAAIHRRQGHRRCGQLRALWRSGCRGRLPREMESRVPIGGALHRQLDSHAARRSVEDDGARR